MRAFLIVAVLVLVGIAVLGFYRDWFSLTTENTDQKPSATFTVDQNKMREDGDKAKEGMQSFGQNPQEKTDDQTEKIEQ